MRLSFKNSVFALTIGFDFVLAAFIAYGALYLSGAVFNNGEEIPNGDVPIFVRSNGVHTDLCLPVKYNELYWGDFIPLEDFANGSNCQYLAIGWGDKGFYIDTPEWDDLTLGTALTAVFLPSETAMHVSALSYKPQINKKCALVNLNETNYALMVDYVRRSFTKKENKPVLIQGAGYSKYDQFYEANGNYHLFKTCNTWTNEALDISGVPTGWYALSAEGIMRHLQ